VRKTFLILLVSLCFAGAAQAQGQGVMEYRAWQFQSGNWAGLKKQIPMAKEMGLNRIQLSHHIIMNAQEMWEGMGQYVQRKLVEDCIELAKKNDLKVDVWVHEFSGVPGEFVTDGRLMISDRLWDWLRAKYARLFGMFPEIDGLVLTFAETEYKLYLEEEVDAGDDVLAHFVKMIDVISEECEKRGKTLIVRTFIHRPEELDVVVRGIRRAAAEIDRDNIIVMAKCAAHDWQPYYPYSPVFRQDMGFPMIVEMDSGQEYTAKSWIPHAEVDYTRRVIKIARQRGAIGAVTRVDRYEHSAIGTLNEVNVYAFSRLLHDPGLSNEDIWSEWAGQRFGREAAPLVASALSRTFDITNMILFPLQQWTYDHSRIASYSYAKGHIRDYGGFSVARWGDSPYYERQWEIMACPDGDTFIKVSHEKELARLLLAESYGDIEAARPHLEDSGYAELKRAFDMTGAMIDITEHHTLALLETMRYEKLAEEGGNPEEAGRLKGEIENHLDALSKLGQDFSDRFGDDSFGGVKSKLEDFVEEVGGIISGGGAG